MTKKSRMQRATESIKRALAMKMIVTMTMHTKQMPMLL